MQDNPYHTYVAYRDNNAWTSERGAGKFMDLLIKSGTLGKGDKGAVINGMKVVPGSSAMQVVIQANDGNSTATDGHAVIKYNDYSYLCWQESDYTLTLDGASQSQARKSYIVAYIDRDIEYDESDKITESPSVMKFVEVKGTESSSPVSPTRTQIQAVTGVNNPYIILAEITIAAGTGTITTGMIDNTRRITGALSGDLALDPDNSYVTGFFQADANKTKTRIVVTGPNDATPSAISGVQLIWLRKKV